MRIRAGQVDEAHGLTPRSLPPNSYRNAMEHMFALQLGQTLFSMFSDTSMEQAAVRLQTTFAYSSSMTRRRIVAGVAVLVLIIGAVWFVQLGWRGGTDGPIITSPRGFFSGGGQDALIVGEILIEDGCAFLTNEDGTSRRAVVFPAGTRWSESDQAIRIGGELVAAAGAIQGAGGVSSGEALRINVGDRAFEAVSRCLALAGDASDGEPAAAAVFNQAIFPSGGSEITVTDPG